MDVSRLLIGGSRATTVGNNSPSPGDIRASGILCTNIRGRSINDFTHAK